MQAWGARPRLVGPDPVAELCFLQEAEQAAASMLRPRGHSAPPAKPVILSPESCCVSHPWMTHLPTRSGRNCGICPQ